MGARSQKIEQICKKYQIKAFYVFGSRGTELFRTMQDDAIQLAKTPSDLDFWVLTRSPFSMESKVNLTLELESLFGLSDIDLFILQEADAFLAANIIRGERIFAEDSYLADEYELFVLRRAGDFIEIKRIMEAELHPFPPCVCHHGEGLIKKDLTALLAAKDPLLAVTYQ